MSAPATVLVKCDRCDHEIEVDADFIDETDLRDCATEIDGALYVRCSAWPAAWRMALRFAS